MIIIGFALIVIAFLLLVMVAVERKRRMRRASRPLDNAIFRRETQRDE